MGGLSSPSSGMETIGMFGMGCEGGGAAGGPWRAEERLRWEEKTRKDEGAGTADEEEDVPTAV